MPVNPEVLWAQAKALADRWKRETQAAVHTHGYCPDIAGDFRGSNWKEVTITLEQLDFRVASHRSTDELKQFGSLRPDCPVRAALIAAAISGGTLRDVWNTLRDIGKVIPSPEAGNLYSPAGANLAYTFGLGGTKKYFSLEPLTPARQTRASKSDWLKAVKSLMQTHPVTDLREKLKSPTFRLGNWKVGTEHQHQFKTVVIQWTGPASLSPPRARNWGDCPHSDQLKGWQYRIQLSPSELPLLLAQLDPQPISADEWIKGFDIQVLQSQHDSRENRLARLTAAPKRPQQIQVTTVVYSRNPDVVVEVLARANGTCEGCKTPAPFHRRSDGTPYLEVHHRKPLASGGEDTVENAVALCPNCHRKAHYA